MEGGGYSLGRVRDGNTAELPCVPDGAVLDEQRVSDIGKHWWPRGLSKGVAATQP